MLNEKNKVNDKKIYPFKSPTLTDHNGDLSKRWYIEFYCYDENSKRLARQRRYGINKIIPKICRCQKCKAGGIQTPECLAEATRIALRERYKYGSRKCNQWHSEMLAGDLFIKDKNPPPVPVIDENYLSPDIVKNFTFKQAIDLAVKKKSSTGRHRTSNAYSSFSNVLTEWMEKYNYSDIPFLSVNANHIGSFFTYLMESGTRGNTTFNNYLILCRSLFNFYLKKELIPFNPCNGTDFIPEDEPERNVAFSGEQLRKLKKIIPAADRQLWSFVQFMFYSLGRPNELRQLKVKHITADKILFPGKISKNRKTKFITITPGLAAVIKKMKLHKYSPEDYVFSKKEIPGLRMLCTNHFTARHLAILRQNKFSSDYTLYSWKHTGVVQMHLAGIDLKVIKEQCRHHSIEVTDKYLRSLGLFSNETLIAKAPVL